MVEKLREGAELLQQQEANPFRVRAYRQAADALSQIDESVDEVLRRSGVDGLRGLPHVGPRIAAAIQEILRTGRWSQIDRLRGTLDPERLFQTIPGVGGELSRRIHERLHVHTLESLEIAAHDGRLAAVPGVGPRRAAMIRAALASMLGRGRPRRDTPAPEPSVAELLDIDREYRVGVAADRLPKIAPRRFNPTGERWLPILHTERADRHYTALFSNTALAHRLGREKDWVVIYFHTDDHPEGQRTVVTETRGSLKGMRVVRGREVECRAHHGTPEGPATRAAVPRSRPDVARGSEALRPARPVRQGKEAG